MQLGRHRAGIRGEVVFTEPLRLTSLSTTAPLFVQIEPRPEACKVPR
jgi:hypothetical protein